MLFGRNTGNTGNTGNQVEMRLLTTQSASTCDIGGQKRRASVVKKKRRGEKQPATTVWPPSLKPVGLFD